MYQCPICGIVFYLDESDYSTLASKCKEGKVIIKSCPNKDYSVIIGAEESGLEVFSVTDGTEEIEYESKGYDLFSMEATEENCKKYNVWPEFSNIEAVKEISS